MDKEQAIYLIKEHIRVHKIGVYPHILLGEALNMAIDSLSPVTKEQIEKIWKGEWKPTELPYMNECEDCSKCGYRTPFEHGFRFCPACGAPMTDEAVDMMLERWKEVVDGEQAH